ncbi:hypothetical protein [Lysinibacillus xylanilyticus]|uniref:hypothetical protein n=1 Tax=Lysinibacillus xylanilyticus TaxID=582475 RepID=UPI0037F5901C
MNRNEFEIKWGKKLDELDIVIGRKTNIPYSTGCYIEDGLWKIYGIGERQNFSIIAQGTEEEMFEKLDRIIRGKIRQIEKNNY